MNVVSSVLEDLHESLDNQAGEIAYLGTILTKQVSRNSENRVTQIPKPHYSTPIEEFKPESPGSPSAQLEEIIRPTF